MWLSNNSNLAVTQNCDQSAMAREYRVPLSWRGAALYFRPGDSSSLGRVNRPNRRRVVVVGIFGIVGIFHRDVVVDKRGRERGQEWGVVASSHHILLLPLLLIIIPRPRRHIPLLLGPTASRHAHHRPTNRCDDCVVDIVGASACGSEDDDETTTDDLASQYRSTTTLEWPYEISWSYEIRV